MQNLPDQTRRRTLGLIGVGAFGEFALPHLVQHFAVTISDRARDIGALAERHGAQLGELVAAAACDVVVLAVPIRALESVAASIAPHLKSGAMVVDVSSVKVRPMEILRQCLPERVRIVGTHPLFGPQSGRLGIAGLRIAVCGGRGAGFVRRFCERQLGLTVTTTDEHEHDRQMAYVQGLTHLVARIVRSMDIPPLDHPTATFGLLQRMIELVGSDSDELFETITTQNPYAAEVLAEFWNGAERVTRR